MKTINKSANITAIKFECLNDISDIVSFTNAYLFDYDGRRLMCHIQRVFGVAPSIGQYIVKIGKNFFTLSEDEFNSL